MRSGSLVPYLGFWLAVGITGYLVVNWLMSPKIAGVISTDGRGEVVINRSYDQHFYVAGAINGHPVTFMVDTGASLVSINEDIARQIGLSPSGSPASFKTAAGTVAGRIVGDATVQAGGVRVDGIRIGITAAGDQPLLGQNFLNKVELTQTADRMILRPKP